MRCSLSFSAHWSAWWEFLKTAAASVGWRYSERRTCVPGPSQRLRSEVGPCSGAASTVSPHFPLRVRDWLSHAEEGSDPGSSSTLKVSLCDFARFAATARPSCLCRPGTQGAQEGGTETGASEEAGRTSALTSCANLGACFPGFVQFGNNGV